MKNVTTQLLKDLKIMHESNFCHRDLKPQVRPHVLCYYLSLCWGTNNCGQNVLVSKWFPLTIKIGDWGVLKQVGDDIVLYIIVGTPGYMSPEIWGYVPSAGASGYTSSVDIWSLGCLIYAMITNETPFPDTRSFLAYAESRLPFSKRELLKSKATRATIKFIANLLKPYPEHRLTTEHAMEDPWLKTQQERD